MSKHQLAAIMFTDIVGYTELMGKDQAKAMEMVERNQSIQRPILEKHSGKWHKDLGDGSLVSFQSAIEAVNCALEIQKELSGEDELKLRIGIHLGDVTFKEDDIYGDGVNIASRIVSIADPGGIYISESVQKAIRGRTDVQIESLGEFNLKHVDYPVDVFALRGDSVPQPPGEQQADQPQSLIENLSKRNVFRAAVAYIITAAIVYRAVTYFIPTINPTLLMGALAIGLLGAVAFAWRYEFSPTGLVRTQSEQAVVNPYSASQKKPFTGNAVVATLSVVAIATFIVTMNVSNVTADTSKYDVAVMYLENMTDNEKYGDQLVHLIHTNLAEDTSLKVVSRQWIYDAMKEISGESRDPDRSEATEVARLVGARTMLIGRVIRQNQDVVVQVELVDVMTGEILGTEKVEGQMSAIFKLADMVSNQITTPFDVEADYEIAEITTYSYEAYQAYYEGLEAIWNFRLPEARELFGAAIEMDSTFALAWLNYAFTQNIFAPLNVYADLQPQLELIRKAKSLSHRLPEKEKLYVELSEAFWIGDRDRIEQLLPILYQLDPNDRITMGIVLGNWGSNTRQEYYDSIIVQFLQRHPSYGYEINAYAYKLAFDRKNSKALEMVERYVEVEPQNWNPWHSAWEINMMAGNKEVALKYLDTLTSKFLDVETWVLAWIGLGAFYAGDSQFSLDQYDIFKDSLSDREFSSMGPNSLVLQGRFKAARELTDQRIDFYRGQDQLRRATYSKSRQAKTFVWSGEYEEAKAIFENIIKNSDLVFGDGHNPMPFLSHFYLGYIAALEDDQEELQRRIQLLYEFLDGGIEFLDSGIADFRFARYPILLEAERWFGQGNFQKVEEMLASVPVWTKESSPIYLNLQYRLDWKQGNYQAAIDLIDPYYKNVIRGRWGMGGDQDIYAYEMAFSEYTIGRIYEDAGNIGEAIEHYEQFLENFKNSDPGIPEKEDARVRVERLSAITSN